MGRTDTWLRFQAGEFSARKRPVMGADFLLSRRNEGRNDEGQSRVNGADLLACQAFGVLNMARRTMPPKPGGVHNDGYTIAAIPTIYRGRQYRSRLEAKWAAMFDRLGWVHEYEPYDLGKWSPDFLLRSPTGGVVLVEIKPITKPSHAVCQKMAQACFAHGLQDEALGYLLLGVAPIERPGPAVQLGWLGFPHSGKPEADWRHGVLGWVTDEHKPIMRADILYAGASGAGWSGTRTDASGPGFPNEDMLYAAHAMELWADASNAVQWRGPRK